MTAMIVLALPPPPLCDLPQQNSHGGFHMPCLGLLSVAIIECHNLGNLQSKQMTSQT
jgi:hypothetical protein